MVTKPKQINLSINGNAINVFINIYCMYFSNLGIKQEAIACDSVLSGRLQPATCSRHIRTCPIEIVNFIRLID